MPQCLFGNLREPVMWSRCDIYSMQQDNSQQHRAAQGTTWQHRAAQSSTEQHRAAQTHHSVVMAWHGALQILMVLAAALLKLTEGADLGLIAIAPNVFNANELETVSILVKGHKVAFLKVSILTKGTDEVHDMQNVIAHLGHQKLVKLRVDGQKLGNPDVSGKYYVQLTVHCSNFKFDQRMDIIVNRQTGTVFLQTDKTIYSPGQTVYIRVFALDEKRRGSNMPIRVEIKNPQGIITKRDNKAARLGFYAQHYTISSRPLEGKWSIDVLFGANFTESRTIYIDVRKYVLPHFQVEIQKMTQIIDKNTEEIRGDIRARYSFDADVVGKALIIFRLIQDGESENRKQQVVSLSRGVATFKARIGDLYEDGENFGMFADRAKVQVEVHVTEKSTGLTYSAYSRPAPIVNKPYVFTFEGTALNFNPGLPFQFKITLKNTFGQPWKDRKFSLDIIKKETVTTTETIDMQTEENGQAAITRDISPDVKVITLKVKLEGESHVTIHEIPSVQIWEGGFLQVTPSNNAILKPGKNAQFEAKMTLATSMTELHYMLVSGGQIFHVGKTLRSAKDVITFSLHISHDMAPQVRLVSWFIVKNSMAIVSSSILLEIEKECKTNAVVSKYGGGTTITPTKRFELQFTGSIGAKVAMVAVDKSVYFLSNNSRLTREKFFDEFLSRDIGCSPSGGLRPMNVFEQAGLAVLSDHPAFRTSRRDHLDCQKTSNSRRKRSNAKATESDPSEEVCCSLGTQFVNTTQLSLDKENMRKACLTAARQQATSRACRNQFGRCCVKQVVENFRTNLGGRAKAMDPNDMELPFIDDERNATERTNFKDSWMIHSNEEIPNSGTLLKEVTPSNTITTWVIQAITLSATEGMCVAQPLELVSKLDLFLKVFLPHTAVQGEQIELITTVYNTHINDQRVKVFLQGVPGACSDAANGKWIMQNPGKTMIVQAGKSWSARWRFVPMERGSMEITAKLISSLLPADIVRKTLDVVSSGELVNASLTITQQPSNKTASRHFVIEDGSLKYTGVRSSKGKATQNGMVPLFLPEDALTGTAQLTIKFVGDIMTPIIQGFLEGTGKNLRKSVSCGEQTMARLGPTAFTTNYLRQTGKLIGLEIEARNKVDQGINHMLQYRTTSGGFSVWAGLKPQIWLTAFTLKSFAQVRQYLPDEKVFTGAVKWLLSQKNSKGLYHSFGTSFYHKNMAGGLKAGPGLTAYVYIAMFEAKALNSVQLAEVDAGLDQLASEADNIMTAYELALITLALAKGNHVKASDINAMLLAKARDLPGTVPTQRYWPTNPKLLQKRGSQMEVEVTGYGLMAQLALNRPIEESNPLVEWLLRQTYSNKMFATTQSTVVSLQALTEYTAKAVKDDLDMVCTLSEGHAPINTFTLQNANRLVQQQMDITPYLGKNLNIDCEGKGEVYTTIETSYYSAKTAAELCSFDIRAHAHEVSIDKKDEMKIEVCTRLQDANVTMHMPMLEVGIGSGYVPVEDTLVKLVTNQAMTYVDFYQINDRFVVLYMSKIPSDVELCLSFEVRQEVVVKNPMAVSVRVYAYYEPEKIRCMTFYEPYGEANARLDVKCESKDDKFCKCFEHNCPVCYGYGDWETKPLKTISELERKACAPRPLLNFVFETTLVDMEMPPGGEVKYNMKINKVLKEGTETNASLLHQERIFVLPSKCTECQLKRGRTYFIMGKDPKHLKKELEYQISPESYIVMMVPRNETTNMTEENQIINKRHKKFLRTMFGCKK